MADGSVKIDIEADSSKFESELNEIESEAKKGAAGLDDLGDSAEKAGDGLNAADVAAGTFIANGLASLISGVMEAAASLVGLAESTREFREDMARLETAFTSQGHSAETASQVYKDFYAILGESDRSVEAANHLAELTKNEKELAQWSTIAAGVSAKFGDSLPIEGLTEAANETAKVGAVTGPLADALNWAGKSEEEFNKQLAECATEQERASLITETLNGLYKDAAAEYNELTESTQNARLATAEMEEAQADIGAALEPVTTAWTNFKANALEAILPVIQWVADAIMDLNTWLKEHETAATIITGVVIALAAAFGVFAAALGISMLIQVVTAALASLGAVMAVLASPITIIIAAVAALAAGFIYLWNNCDGFREFWIDLWAKLKEAAAAVAEWFKAIWPEVVDALKKVWEPVGAYFAAIWETIKGIFSVVKAVLSGNFSDAWIAIKGIVGVWANYFSGVWSNIRGVFSAVSGWFGQQFSAAKTAITNIWDSVAGYFSDLYAKIKGAFSGVLSDFQSVGSNIIDGIWNGISAGWDWLVGKVKNLAKSLFDAAKNALDINSPSRKFMYVGEMSAAGIDKGFEDQMRSVEKGITGDLDALTARVQASVGVSGANVSRSMGRSDTGFVDLARAVGVQTAGINSLSAQYRAGATNSRPIVLELDGRELGRAVVNTGGMENSRTGVKLALGGAL